MNLKKLTLCIFIIINTGCHGNTYAYNNAIVPAYRTISVGNTVSVNQTLVIKPNLARVYFQNGEIQPEQQIDKYYPNCSLEIKTLSSSAQSILPDQFAIYRITLDEEYSRLEIQFAGLYFFGSDGGPSPENWVTHFYLSSEKQPDVYRLSCQHWEDPTDARHVTYSEIKKTLGKYISFNF